MKVTKRLFIPDTHAPDHDNRAFDLMLQVAEDFRPDEVVYLGDFFDCYCVGNYTLNPNKTFSLLEDELKAGRELLAKVEKASQAKSYVFLQGNHEYRIDRYFNTYASKLKSIMPTRDILGIPKNYKWYPYGQDNHYACGKLIATHGSITNKHVASSMLAKYGCSVLFGHTHKIQEFQVRTLTGETHRGINIGWLGDALRAGEYISNVADWSHGFAVGYFLPRSGDFFTQVIHIIDYKCVFNGKVYKA